MAESGNPTSQNAVSDATASSTDASGSVLVAALGSVGEGAAQLLKSALGSPRSAPGMSPRTKVNEQRESADASGSGGRSDGGADWEAKSKTGSEGAQDGHASAGSFAAPARSSSALSYVHSSTRSDSSKGRDGQKRHAMPCITLREDSRGYVTLFGMEPGGELEHRKRCTMHSSKGGNPRRHRERECADPKMEYRGASKRRKERSSK